MGSYENAALPSSPPEFTPSLAHSPQLSPSVSQTWPGVERVAAPSAPHLLPPDQEPQGRTAIPLGTVVGSETRAWWFPEPSSGAPNPHMVVCGASGFGKTYLLTSLIAELAQRGLPALVFDFGQGFAESELPPEVTSHVRFQQIEVNSQAVAINPLALFDSDVRGPVNAAQRVADTFQRVYPKLGVQQHSQIRDAVLDCFENAGIRRKEPSTWSRPTPPFSMLRTALELRAGDRDNPGHRAAGMAASHISTLFVFEVFTRRGLALDWGGFLQGGSPWVIQLAGLEHSVARATA